MDNPCPREASQQSPHSPGTVSDDEDIVLVVIEPLQWKDGGLIPSAFGISKLRTGDLSVARAQWCSGDDLQKNVVKPALERDTNRKLIGGLTARCAQIRAITALPEKVRAVCVIDDGLEDHSAHAVLSFRCLGDDKNFWQRNDREAVRANLLQLFESSGPPRPLERCCSAAK